MRRLALYGLNGVVNTVVSYAIFFCLTQVIDYRVAIAVGYAVGMVLSYVLNSRIVFRATGRPLRFVAVNLAVLTLNIAVTWAVVSGTGIREELAQLVAIPVVFLTGFVLNKVFVFGHSESTH